MVGFGRLVDCIRAWLQEACSVEACSVCQPGTKHSGQTASLSCPHMWPWDYSTLPAQRLRAPCDRKPGQIRRWLPDVVYQLVGFGMPVVPWWIQAGGEGKKACSSMWPPRLHVNELQHHVWAVLESAMFVLCNIQLVLPAAWCQYRCHGKRGPNIRLWSCLAE